MQEKQQSRVTKQHAGALQHDTTPRPRAAACTELPSHPEPCYHRGMPNEDTPLALATRLKAKMESFGYKPTIEAVLASVQKAQGADFIHKARRSLMFDRVDGWPEQPIETVIAILKERCEEREAWNDHLILLAKRDGRDLTEVLREFRSKVPRELPEWARRKSS